MAFTKPYNIAPDNRYMNQIANLKKLTISYQDTTKPLFKTLADQNLSSMAANSTLWAFADKIFHRAIQLLVTAFAARILVPEDFGLVGMAILVMGVIGIFKDYGLTTSIIYDKKIDQIDLSTAFWVNLSVGALLFLVMYLSSPLSAAYFSNNKVPDVVKLLSINFLFTGIGVVNGTILIKAVRFKQLAIISIVATVLQASVTLLLIFGLNMGYWGIICGILAYSLTDSILKIAVTRWLPNAIFDFQRLKKMFHYGKNIFLQKILNYFSSNIDYFIIGRLLGSASLGIYQFAYMIPHSILNEFSQNITKVLFPIFCQVQDDPERFKAGYLKINQYISFVSFPAMIGLFFVADQFIYLAFGNKYMAAVLPMKILCFSGMAKSVLHTMGIVFNSKGRPDLGLKWNIILFPIIGTAVYFGTRFNLAGVAVALTVTSYLGFFGAYMAARIAGIPFVDYIKSFLPALIGSFVMLICLYVLMHLIPKQLDVPTALEFAIFCSSGILVYASFLFIFYKKTLFEIFYILKKGFPKKKWTI